MVKEQMVHLGYEVGTGEAVAIPLRHMAVTGQTQQSGKTTTLEALISRSEGTALTFITKRGEASFTSGRRIRPYFRDRADWQFVTSILDATLQEKNKFLRPWIIKICRSTKSLAEVQQRVQDALITAKGIHAGVYTQLDAYLELIVPEIERADLAGTLDLRPGLNVMDVSDFATPMQMLFVQSALDWVNARCRDTTVVIPEAWEFMPQSKGSPVKASVETLVRKGAGLGNHIWLDSQDMAGVDNLALRACTVWLIGVQRETNEIKRNLANIPANLKRPSPADVATLERGQFFACFGKTVAKVYVQPSWMPMGQAFGIATGKTQIDDPGNQPPPAPARSSSQETAKMDAKAECALNDEIARLRADLAGAEQRGYERGLESGLRQAGDFWSAAALDMRDAAQKVVEIGEHLAGVARDGRWSLPRGEAKPKNDASAGRKQREGAAAGPPGRSAIAMLDALVLSYPLQLEPREWALFAGKSPNTAKSGPWYKDVRALTAAGFIEPAGTAFLATAEGVEQSTCVPAEPMTPAELWRIWRAPIAEEIGAPALAMLNVLATHRRHKLTSEQWALLAGKSVASSKSGPWYTAVRTLKEWDLIAGDGPFAITDKGCALFEGLGAPRGDTAEALRLARRSRLSTAQRHYDHLTKPMARADLASALGISEKSAKSGPWYTAIKEMLESGLVAEKDGNLFRRAEELA